MGRLWQFVDHSENHQQQSLQAPGDSSSILGKPHNFFLSPCLIEIRSPLAIGIRSPSAMEVRFLLLSPRLN